MDDFSEIKLKKASNGWVLVMTGEDGEEYEAHEIIRVDDSIPKSESQHEQECLAFAQALRSINEKMGPGTLDGSSFSIGVAVNKLEVPPEETPKTEE